MKCVIVLMAYLTFNVAVAVDCDTVDCRRQNSAVNPWHNLLVSRGRLLKDKVKSRGRFWNREMGLNSIRRGSVRWGKRFDSKQWQNAFKDLLRPTKLAMGRNWTPTITDVLPRENTELEVNHLPGITEICQKNYHQTMRDYICQ
ncbi:hypothetical protein OSTOST_25966 [Ostertagia ostertagi]